MAWIRYTARDGLLSDHVAGVVYSFEIGLQEGKRSRAVTKVQPKSLGGAVETIRHRTETSWDIQFEPVSGWQRDRLREFLDSTDGGEAFEIDLYGNASSYRSVYRTDDGYDEQPFMRMGSEQADLFVMSITVTER